MHSPSAFVAMNQFRLEGEYWTVEFEGTVVRLRDTKGLQYVAHLLRHPGEHLLARVLEEAVEGRVSGVAAEQADPVESRAEEERARSAVSKRIKAALRRIHPHHPALGRYLMATIKTGRTCIYLPDPVRPVEFST